MVDGYITLDKPLDRTLREYLTGFSKVLHYKVDKFRLVDVDKANTFNGKLGVDGEYYIGKQHKSNSNKELAGSCPSSLCNFMPDQYNSYRIIFDNSYNVSTSDVSWLRYIIKHFLKPSGYMCNGEFSSFELYKYYIKIIDNVIYELNLDTDVIKLIDSYIDLLGDISKEREYIDISKAIEFAKGIKNKLYSIG